MRYADIGDLGFEFPWIFEFLWLGGAERPNTSVALRSPATSIPRRTTLIAICTFVSFVSLWRTYSNPYVLIGGQPGGRVSSPPDLTPFS
jgi:hypothetical protein